MIDKRHQIDVFDLKSDCDTEGFEPVATRLAQKVGLSQNACWRRLQRLYSIGMILGAHSDIDLSALGLDLTVFVMVRTRHHFKDWIESFRDHVDDYRGVIDFYRIGGDWDYLIKVVTRGMSGYDAFYQRLVTDFDLATVTGFFTMEAIINNRAVDLDGLR